VSRASDRQRLGSCLHDARLRGAGPEGIMQLLASDGLKRCAYGAHFYSPTVMEKGIAKGLL
jgi:hypothetical protein